MSDKMAATGTAAAAASANMYRVGDYVYFETSSSAPYQIRRIEELVKTANGNVEAKVMCFYRRRDISSSLTILADKHQSALEEENEREAEELTDKQKHQLKHRELFLSRQIETLPATHIRGKCVVTLLNETESLSSYLERDDCYFYTLVYDPQQKTLLADRGEIRVGSRFQAESLPKVLADGEEDGRELSQMEELEYTPDNPLTDRQIEQFLTIAKSVGTFARALDHSSSVKQPSLHMSAATASRDVTISYAMKILHQCDYDMGKAVLALVPASGPILCRDEMEDWSASEANLFEEAMDKERYGKDFSDIRADYLPWKSLRSIVEYYYMWKTTDRYVQQKRVKAVEAESKLKQVYIPIYNQKPNVANGGTGNMGMDNAVAAVQGRNCESCAKPTSSQWYAWGPAHVQCRLCHGCWFYWKKFGGLKYASKLDAEKVMNASTTPTTGATSANTSPVIARTDGPAATPGKGEGQYPCSECSKVFNRQERLMAHMAAHRPNRCNYSNCGKEFKFKAHLARHCAQAHGIVIRTGSPRPIMKTRAAFYLSTNEATKVARRTCAHLFRPRHAARKPFQPINAAAIKTECATRYATGPAPDLPAITSAKRGSVVDVSHKLGTPLQDCPEWLVAAPRDQLPQPERLAFTPPPRGEDGQFIMPRPLPPPERKDVEENPQNQNRNIWGINNNVASKKRTYEHTNGVDNLSQASQSKRRQLAPTGLLNAKSHELYGISGMPKCGLVSNGRPKVATITRVGGRKQMISWVDAPDDVFFIATDMTRRVRRQLPSSELRRGARKPWRRVGGKHLSISSNNNHTNHNSSSNNNNNSTNGTSNNVHAMDLGQMA